MAINNTIPNSPTGTIHTSNSPNNTGANYTNILITEKKILKKALSKVRSQRGFFIFCTLMFFSLSIWMYLYPINNKDFITLHRSYEKLKISNDSLLDLIPSDTIIQKKSNLESASIDFGIFYSVQIKTFVNKIPLISDNFITMYETTNSTKNIYRYSIGIYSSKNEAILLRDNLEKIGFKDCFIVTIKDGIRQ